MTNFLERALAQRSDYKPASECHLVIELLPNKRSESFWRLHTGSAERKMLDEVCSRETLTRLLSDGQKTLRICLVCDQKCADEQLKDFCELLEDASLQVCDSCLSPHGSLLMTLLRHRCFEMLCWW
jgi:hypothetical protein